MTKTATKTRRDTAVEGAQQKQRARDFTKQINWAPYIATQVGVPPVVVGPPGGGKTQSFGALADITDRYFDYIELTKTPPEDYLGMPAPGKMLIGDKVVRCFDYLPSGRLLRLQQQPSLMLFDELTNANEHKQGGVLTHFSNGIPNTWLVGACNPETLAADGHALTPPFINRVWLGQWEADNDAHDIGLLNSLVFPPPLVPIVAENWEDNLAAWGAIIVDYLSRFPSNRDACPTDWETACKPFPSKRSWANLARCLAGATDVGANNVTRTKLITGLIGTTVGTHFDQYLQRLDLPAPEQLLANGGKDYKIPDRMDLAFATAAGVCGIYKNAPTALNRENLMAFAEVIRAQSPEIAEIVDTVLTAVPVKD